MTPFQKAVKYIAIALAVALIAAILGGILSVVGVIGLLGESNAVTEKITAYPVSENVTQLNLQISAADLTVEVGERFSVESNLKDLTVSEKNGVLTVREKDTFFKNYNGAVLKLTIPENTVFSSAKVETGAGRVRIDTLSAEVLQLELGAGEVTIGQLNATRSAELEGGAGKITVRGGTLRDLQLEMGIGQMNLTSALLGSSELDLGVGETNLNLIGTRDDYTVLVEKGIGSATVDGVQMENESRLGTGENRVEITGGVGSINVNFQN